MALLTDLKVEIEIKKEKPPKWLWDEAHIIFEINDEVTVYSYGNIIYDPGNHSWPVSKSVIAHEMTHMRQQGKIGSIEKWWVKYFTDPEFRKMQEVEAYHTQYKHYCTIDKDRNNQAKYLNMLAGDFSSPLYKINLSRQEAMQLIKYGK